MTFYVFSLYQTQFLKWRHRDGEGLVSLVTARSKSGRKSCSTSNTFGGKSGRIQAGVIERKAKVEGQLCQSVGPLVCWSVGLLVHTCIEIMTVFCFSAPAHPSATGGRVYSLHLNFIKLDPGLKAYNLIVIQLIEIKFMR